MGILDQLLNYTGTLQSEWNALKHLNIKHYYYYTTTTTSGHLV